MCELTLKEIQKLSLEILLDVHRFCINNGIKYSLAYGTLLGAARHKGFIPWDDDVDIVMTRPEYDRFVDGYKSDSFVLVSDKDSYVCFARVCDVKTYTRTITPWTNRRDLGVCIDVFPIDGTSDSFFEFSRQITLLADAWHEQIICRRLKKLFSSDLTLKQNLTLFCSQFRNANITIEEVNRRLITIATQVRYGTTGHCSQLVCIDNGDREFFLTSFFETYTTMSFEGHDLMVACGWRDMLKLCYGDYLQLPPEHEQKPHATYIKYYWKV